MIGSGNWNERLALSLGYMWLISLGPVVSIIGMLIGGFLVAIVVTSNHQTEDIIATDAPYCFVTDNFSSTRGVRCDNVVTEYLFGGMQYQLEHHLFPTMPRYNYPKLRPLIKDFSSENKLPFKVSGVQEILMMNYETIKKHTGHGKSILDTHRSVPTACEASGPAEKATSD